MLTLVQDMEGSNSQPCAAHVSPVLSLCNLSPTPNSLIFPQATSTISPSFFYCTHQHLPWNNTLLRLRKQSPSKSYFSPNFTENMLQFVIRPERWRIGRPFQNVILKGVAVKSQEVSPVWNFLGLHIETGGKPRCLGRVVGVILQPLTLRQPKELLRHVLHLPHHLLRNPVIHNLQNN